MPGNNLLMHWDTYYFVLIIGWQNITVGVSLLGVCSPFVWFDLCDGIAREATQIK
jgi:hypothetical protein